MDPAYLQVKLREKVYSIENRKLHVLSVIEFDVREGEFVSILGPSGAGKTTLLRLIAGLERGYMGDIVFSNHRVVAPDRDRGIVFQESRLLPWMTVAQNIEFSLPMEIPASDRAVRISNVLRLVGLESFRTAWPHELSGGMEKRVALARTLVNLPRLLLLDEPFGALDTFAKMGLQDELARLHQLQKLSTILVTHDVDEAVYLSDRVILLTPSPSEILQVFSVPLKRPRDRTSMEFECMRTEILGRILEKKG